jgi:hypothetical protein
MAASLLAARYPVCADLENFPLVVGGLEPPTSCPTG